MALNRFMDTVKETTLNTASYLKEASIDGFNNLTNYARRNPDKVYAALRLYNAAVVALVSIDYLQHYDRASFTEYFGDIFAHSVRTWAGYDNDPAIQALASLVDLARLDRIGVNSWRNTSTIDGFANFLDTINHTSNIIVTAHSFYANKQKEFAGPNPVAVEVEHTSSSKKKMS